MKMRLIFYLILIGILISACNRRVDSYEQAKLEFDNGNYKIALSMLDKTLSDKNIDSVNVYSLRGKCFWELNDYKSASEELWIAYKLNTEDLDLRNLLAASFHRSENYEMAMRIYQSIYIKNPDYPSIYYNMGIGYFNVGHYGFAIKEINRSFRKEDTPPDAYYYLASAHYLLDQSEQALNYVEKDIAYTSELVPELYLLRGRIHKDLGNNDSAMVYLNKAYSLDSTNTITNLYRGRIFLEQGDNLIAIKELSLFIDEYSDNAAVHELRAIAYFRIDSLEKACDDFAKAYLIEPDRPKHPSYFDLCK